VRVVIVGPPGAGKGTQARLLMERFGVPQISTGDILREAQHNGSRLGHEAARYMAQGQLVPDDVVIGIVEERLGAPDCAPGFVLDGFPRTVRQAEALDRMLARQGWPLDAVIVIEVPREELVRRLAGRRVCRRCGTMFHAELHPPTEPGMCDRCGGELYQREDDREETVRRRLDVSAQEMAPVVAHYRDAGLLRETAGTGSREDVFARMTGIVQGQ
jgi:adenylate kinase